MYLPSFNLMEILVVAEINTLGFNGAVTPNSCKYILCIKVLHSTVCLVQRMMG